MSYIYVCVAYIIATVWFKLRLLKKSIVCELVTEVKIEFSYQFNNLRIKLRKVHSNECESILKKIS